MIWSANRRRFAHARSNSLPPISQYRSRRRNRFATNFWAVLKASAKVSSPVPPGDFKLRTDSPNKKAVVVSRVRRKNRGCRSTTPPSLGRMARRSSTLCLKTSRLSYCLNWNCGRKSSRECFHAAPSCVKIPSPNIGDAIRARGPKPQSWGTVSVPWTTLFCDETNHGNWSTA